MYIFCHLFEFDCIKGKPNLRKRARFTSQEVVLTRVLDHISHNIMFVWKPEFIKEVADNKFLNIFNGSFSVMLNHMICVYIYTEPLYESS